MGDLRFWRRKIPVKRRMAVKLYSKR